MKHWLTLGLAALLAPAAASAADMTGTWTINGNFNDVVKYTVTCDLAETAGKFGGPCKDNMGQSFTCSGADQGAKVLLSYDTTYNGAPVHLNYTGAVQADGSLKGSVDAGIAQGVFTAAR